MAVQPNAVFTLQADYKVLETGITLHFVCADPGPGTDTDYLITITDAELAGISTLSAARTLMTTKLQRLIRLSGIASKLDPLVGQSITV